MFEIGRPKAENKIGMVSYTKNGDKMTIVEYINSQNMNVLFENGLIKYKVQYSKFLEGSVLNPLNLPENRVGEISYNTFGLKMEIIEYIGSTDLTVKFEDGYTTKTAYKEFKSGQIKNPLHKGHDKTGEMGCNTHGNKMKVIKYTNAMNIVVEFDSGYITECTYQNFQLGKVKDYYNKQMLGIGYLGEGLHKTNINRESTKKYRMWCGMLQRCYSDKYHIVHPTYKDCTVVDFWHNFQRFGDWYDENYYEIESCENMQLDKDIIIKHNKIYSPDTCVIVPRNINLLFTRTDSKRGDCPLGVSWNKRNKAYETRCNDGNGNIQLLGYGVSLTKEKAFLLYKEYKENLIKQIADLYKDKIPQKLYDALYRYQVEITD